MHTIINKIILSLIAIAFSMSAMAQDTLSVKPAEEPAPTESEDIDSLPLSKGEGLGWEALPLPARLDTIVKRAKILETSQMGLLVYDLTTDSIIYAHDALQTLRPASTMKIITAITALDKLGTDYEYRTQLGYAGKIIESTDSTTQSHSGSTLHGDIYIIGGMDPMISRNDLRHFADSLKSLGIDTIRGNLYADRSFKDDDLYGEGWCWDDDNAMLSPLVFKRKDNMMEIFRDIINERGIVFIGEIHDGLAPLRHSAKGHGWVHLGDITHPLTAVLKPMMKQSNNLYAESMLYQIGATQGLPSTAKKARKVEEALLKKIERNHSFPVDSADMRNAENRGWVYRLADGSGLSLYNYLSADIEVAFLRYAYQHDVIYKALYDSLPIAGVDGTLSDRMKGTSAKGNVHAKTGTLTGISSLAGYCTAKNGHLLAFAIINQNVMKAIYAKRLQDKICITLTK